MPIMMFIFRYVWVACDVGLGRLYGRTGDDTQDCIRFQFAKAEALYREIDFSPHKKVLHLNGEPIGSLANMETYVKLGLGVEVDNVDEPGIYEMQGWGAGGHACTIIRRPDDGSLWTMDFTTKTTDGLRPITWADIQRWWPNRMIVKLRVPA